MSRLRSLLLLSILVCCCTIARVSSADSPAAPAARAAELVQQAGRESRAGRWQNALDAYRAAWAIQRSHDVAAELGLVELRLGKMRDAAEHFAYSLSSFPATAAAARRKLLEERFAQARAKVTALSIEVNEPAAQILVGGQHAGTSPLPEVFVESGMTEITAKKPGYVPARMVVLAEEGGSQRVMLTLKREPAAPSPPRAVTPRKDVGPPPVKGYEEPLLFSMIGLTGVTLATGTALMIAGASAVDEAAVVRDKLASAGVSACAATPPPADCALLKNRLQTGSDLHWAGAGLLIAGGAGVVAATVYGLVLYSKRQRHGAIRMIPVVGVQSGAAWIAGNW